MIDQIVSVEINTFIIARRLKVLWTMYLYLLSGCVQLRTTLESFKLHSSNRGCWVESCSHWNREDECICSVGILFQWGGGGVLQYLLLGSGLP